MHIEDLIYGSLAEYYAKWRRGFLIRAPRQPPANPFRLGPIVFSLFHGFVRQTATLRVKLNLDVFRS